MLLRGTALGLARAFFRVTAHGLSVGVRHSGAAAAIDDQVAGLQDTVVTKPHHHRNAPRPGQHRHMACRAAPYQRDGATLAPVRFEESCRSDILTRQHGAHARGATCFARKVAQHPVADVPHVGGAGAKVIILGSFVSRDFTVQRIGPGRVRGRASVHGHQGRGGEGVVFQHGHLEGENVLCVTLHTRHQRGKVFNGRGDCIL